MEIKGQVNEFIYQNEVNGYTICTFITDEEEITVVRLSSFYKCRRYINTNWQLRYASRIW